MKVKDINLKDMQDMSEMVKKIKYVDGEVFGNLFGEEKAVKYGEFAKEKHGSHWIFDFGRYRTIYSDDFNNALAEVVKDIANDGDNRCFKLRSRACPKDKKLNRNFYDEEDVADYICYKLDLDLDELYEYLFGIDIWESYGPQYGECDDFWEVASEYATDEVFRYLSGCSFNVLGELIRNMYPNIHVCFWTEYGWSPCLEG